MPRDSHIKLIQVLLNSSFVAKIAAHFSAAAKTESCPRLVDSAGCTSERHYETPRERLDAKRQHKIT
jgi:hypothetical protein